MTSDPSDDGLQSADRGPDSEVQSVPDGYSPGGTKWPVILIVPVVLILACYVFATPRNGGPDEPSHAVFSAAVVRGDLSGESVPGDRSRRLFQVPAMVGQPDPGCWAQEPFIAVNCASLGSASTDTVSSVSRSSNYAPWAFVLPGLASLVPSASEYMYLARILMVLVPLLLVVGALAQLHGFGPGVRSAALLGVTPIAWFSMSIVNPSAIAIAGGFALWAAMLARTRTRGDVLLVCAWAAVLLPRRDGPLWATFIVLGACLVTSVEPLAVWRSLSSWARMAVTALAVLPVLTMAFTDTSSADAALALTPLALVAASPVVALHRRSSRPRLVVAGTAGGALIAVAALVVRLRPGGFQAQVLRAIMGNTGEHLRQLVGVLSWLDAPVPWFAVFLFWAVVGGLITVARLEQPRVALVGGGIVVLTVLTAWTLELGQGADYGRYWQGRYSIPFTIGLPLVLAVRVHGGRVIRSASVDSLALPIAASAWVIWNAGFAAALQRWGVGLGGSWWPTDWNTWGSALPPWLLLVVHAVATAWLTGAAAAGHREPPVNALTQVV